MVQNCHDSAEQGGALETRRYRICGIVQESGFVLLSIDWLAPLPRPAGFSMIPKACYWNYRLHQTISRSLLMSWHLTRRQWPA